MKVLYGIHIIAMIILFCLGIIYIREFQIVIATIETWGFDPIAYATPSRNFAKRALFFCLFTMFVGFRTWSKMPTTGSLLLMGGGVFFVFAATMLIVPRYANIQEVFPYWGGYILGALLLTIVASLKFEQAPIIKPDYGDDILDEME